MPRNLKKGRKDRFIKGFKRFFKLTPKRALIPHKPTIYLEIILALIMSASVLIIPIAEVTTSYQQTHDTYKGYAENASDNKTKTFWQDQVKRYEGKKNAALTSLITDSYCAIFSVFGVIQYLDKKMKSVVFLTKFGTFLFLVSLILLTVSIIT